MLTAISNQILFITAILTLFLRGNNIIFKVEYNTFKSSASIGGLKHTDASIELI